MHECLLLLVQLEDRVALLDEQADSFLGLAGALLLGSRRLLTASLWLGLALVLGAAGVEGVNGAVVVSAGVERMSACLLVVGGPSWDLWRSLAQSMLRDVLSVEE